MKRIQCITLTMMWLCVIVITVSAQSQEKFARQGVVYQEIEEAPEFMHLDSEQVSPIVITNATSRSRYVFADQSGFTYQMPEGSDWGRYIGKKVEVLGRLRKFRLNNVTVLPLGDVSSSQVAMTGEYKVLVVVLSFNSSDQTPESSYMTVDEARRSLFDDPKNVNLYYKSASFNRLWLSGHLNPNGDVAYINLNVDVSQCTQKISNDYRNLIIQNLQAQDIAVGNYHSIFVVHNELQCPQVSSAGIRPPGYMGTLWATMTKNTQLLSPRGVAHELGHMLGLQHASQLNCPSSPTAFSSCTVVEYGDVGVMGLYYYLPNTFERRKLGWFNQSYRRIASSLGMLDMYSPSLENAGGRSGKSLTSGQNFYIQLGGAWTGYDLYLEARRTITPFDIDHPLSEIVMYHNKGVRLMIAPSNFGDSGSRSYLIDTTTNTPYIDDAPILESSYSINNVTVTNTRRFTAMSGTRVSVLF